MSDLSVSRRARGYGGGLGYGGIDVGGGLQVGGIVIQIELAATALLVLMFIFPRPLCHINQVYQTWLMVIPGPTGFKPVIDSTWPPGWPGLLFPFQSVLLCTGPMPWACVEQHPPTNHFFFTAD